MRKKKSQKIIEKILSASSEESELLEELLERFLHELILLVQEKLEQEPISSIRKIKIFKPKEMKEMDFSMKRTSSTIHFDINFLHLRQTERKDMLYFLIMKECLFHFLSFEPFADVTEAVVDILTTLILKEVLEIRSLDHHLITAIRSRIYCKDIAEKSYNYWDSLLQILFRQNISAEIVFHQFNSLIREVSIKKWSKEQLIEQFRSFVVSKIKGEEIIAPHFLSSRLQKIINHFLELGFEKSTTGQIAELMGLHINTIRRAFRELSSRFNTFWKTEMNYEKLKLYPHLFRISLPNQKAKEIVEKYLMEIPYVEQLFEGKTVDEEIILYSSTFNSPLSVSNQLQHDLQKLSNNELINDYVLQMIRQRIRYATITTEPFNPKAENFSKLILNEEKSIAIQKLILTDQKSHLSFPEADSRVAAINNQKASYSLKINDELPTVNYNQLYFLAILKCRYLIKGRYGVWIDEFYDLCKQNDIDLSEVSTQMDFINQMEIQTRRKGLLDYWYSIRAYGLQNDILGIEIPLAAISEKSLQEVIDKVRVFSSSALLKLYDRWFYIFQGINHKHPVAQLLQAIFNQEGLPINMFTIRSKNFRFVPLHELFDFDSNRWKVILPQPSIPGKLV
ncbi:MAG: hypothetical protein GF308_08875 [Candidatus Heimdallarchaeota archaeon]|nr:hypothetical protein [Candidatus Heimdallarchaeota archaeon]